jgi:HEAT repeat protein
VRLAQRGFGITQSLISILSDHAKPGLAGIARVLGRVCDKRAIPALTQAARQGDEDLRMAALWALAQFREPEILPILLTEAERIHPVTQSYLTYVLGTFQDPQVIPLLTRLAGHGSREVAFQAAFALGDFQDPRSVAGLKKALRRRDPLLRSVASASLTRLGVSHSLVLAGVATWWKWVFAAGILAAAAGFFFYR